MPKVTFIKDGKETTVEFEHGKMPFQEHGLPESFLDVAMNFGIHLIKKNRWVKDCIAGKHPA